MSSTQYATVLPHEPLPRPPCCSSGGGGSRCDGDGDSNRPSKDNKSNFRGYVHLQGAFVPKRKESKDNSNSKDKDNNQQATTEEKSNSCRCQCNDIAYIENTLQENLQRLISQWCMNSTDICSIEALQDSSSVTATDANDNANNISKVRLTLSSPAAARTINARLRRGAYSPRDLLSSSIDTGGDIHMNNEGLCPHGCGGRYAGRPLQVTQVSPVITNNESSSTTSQNQNDNNNDALASESSENDESRRWARAAPPKFRRLQLTTDTTTTSIKNRLTEEELEHKRGNTRFVYMENVLTGLRSEDIGSFFDDDKLVEDGTTTISDNTDQQLKKVMKENLLSVLQGSDGAKNDKMLGQLHHRGMIEDDVRHAFQEGLRNALCRDGVCPSQNNDNDCHGVELFMKSDTTGGKKNKAGKKNGATNGGGDSSSSSAGIKMLYDHLHVGMRSNADATKLIRSWQGKRVSITMELPTSFMDQVVSMMPASISSSAQSSTTLPKQVPTVTIITGKLFLDYADVMLPKGRQKGGVPRGKSNNNSENAASSTEKMRGEKSRSECTSKTSHVHIPGLHLIPNYVTEREERILMAALTGPHAPWAPPQHTMSGGLIRRRVQHYGYVFDYESADVLRRNEDGDGGERHACPPLPSMESSRESVLEMTGEDVERRIEEAVEDVRGWDALAGVIERTRRFDFENTSSSSAEDKLDSVEHKFDEELNGLSLNGRNETSLKDGAEEAKLSVSSQQSGSNGSQQTHPHINQLTINEYTPGQGIGSHVDTESAFDDGLLIITLNGGIVMEFRQANVHEKDVADDGTKKLLYLPPRSLVLISGDARYKWEHMIVSRTTDTVDGKVLPRKLRVSLTLRTALTAPIGGHTAPPLPIYESALFPPRWGQPSDADAEVDRNCAMSPEGHSDLVTPSTEAKHVHAVYDAIATQWHHTRGKRGVLWPGATAFLENLPRGSIVADVGCGDGKYFSAILGCDSYVIGTDISEPLLKTAATTSATAVDNNDSKKKDVLDNGPQYQKLSTEKQLALSAHPAVAVADCIHLPFRNDSVDAAICIAVMHHLSTEGRRLRCLSELRRIVNVGGFINVQAWALEQESDSKRKFHGTDLLVPFNAQPKYLETPSSSSSIQKNEGEKADNAQSGETPRGKRMGVAQMMAEQYSGAEFDDKKNLVVFQRYCHMYRRGELESLVEQVPGLEVVESTYEKGNHVVLLRVS